MNVHAVGLIFQVNLVSAYSTEKLHHLQSVVAPFLETYQVVACSLMDLGDNPMTGNTDTLHIYWCILIYSALPLYHG